MLTQSKVQTAGITDKKQKDILGIPSKKAATHTMNRPCGTKKEKPNNLRGSAWARKTEILTRDSAA
jgi:hypothetical protein